MTLFNRQDLSERDGDVKQLDRAGDRGGGTAMTECT